MTDDIAYKTPIADLLKDVPEDARQMYEHHPTHHQNIPFGRLAKEALEEIESLRRERKRLRGALRNIRGHVELIGGSLAKMGAVWHMADEALKGETE